MQLIAHQEVPSGGVASVTFSAIPATFTDLVLVVSSRKSDTSPFVGISFNSVVANLSSRTLYGIDTTVGSEANSTASKYNIFAYTSFSTDTASTFGSTSIYIPNYKSNTAKSVSVDSVNENNASAARRLIGAGLWNDTAAITSIEITAINGSLLSGGLLTEYSSASLYGVLAGSDGIVTVS